MVTTQESPPSRVHPLPATPPARPSPLGGDGAKARAAAEASAGLELARRGQFAAALEHFRQAVFLDAAEPRHHFQLARAARQGGDPKLAQRHFRETVRLDPSHAQGHYQLAFGAWESGQTDLALRHSEAALALDPSDLDFIALRGVALHVAGEPRAAWALIEPLVAAGAAARPLAWVFARVAPAVGREAEAVRVIERALQSPDLPPGPDGRPMLHSSAASLLDRLGRYDEAFAHARLANEAMRRITRPHDPAAHRARIDRLIQICTRERLEALPHATHGRRRPVFIVGVPRSGTSLVEQVLASHPAVFGAGELPALGRIRGQFEAVALAHGDAYPDCLDGLSLRNVNRIAGEYLSHVVSLDRDATYVTDKMPANYLNLELVQLLLPGCHVIHCVRDPLDTCLSNYLTTFAEGNEFSLDLGHLGAYHRDYRRLMDHWRQALTLPMLDVCYEDLVREPGAQVRRLLDFLGLPWDDRCLAFHENRRPVRTASEDQVRRPMYSSSVGRWKHYEKHIAPLTAALAGSDGRAS